MKNFINNILYLCLALLPLNLSAAVTSITVQVDPAATGNYQIVDINEIDWQSSGDIAIRDELPQPATANGSSYSTYASWVANAIVADTVTLELYSHTRANDFLNNAGNSIRPNTLSRDGSSCVAGGGCFEITAAANLLVSAILIQKSPTAILQFSAISGDVNIFLDQTPDSDVTTGIGYTDGLSAISGTFTSITGNFIEAGNGSNATATSISSYDPNIIEVDNNFSGFKITDITFDTLISQVSSGEASVSAGDSIGLLPHTIQVADLVLKADSNSEFLGAENPDEVTACRMTGGGVDDSGDIISGTFAEGTKYTFGGNIRSALPNDPTPGMNWQHNHHGNGKNVDKFAFHVGTPSAPSETKITSVTCFDEGFCFPARPADFQQIKWTGLGTFRNISGNYLASVGVIPSSKANYTLHCMEGHVMDIGEPGGTGAKGPNKDKICPLDADEIFADEGGLGFLNNQTPIVDENSTDPSQCGNCADYYSITIYDTPAANADGSCTGNPIYSVHDFINGGNLQLHPINP